MNRKKLSKTNSIVKGLLDYLTDVGEEDLLGEVSGELSELSGRRKEAEKVEVESVTPLSPEKKSAIQKLVRDYFQKELPVENTINKDIIGGLKISIGDWYFDGSISGQIDRIKKILY